jgi:hypothetical protein
MSHAFPFRNEIGTNREHNGGCPRSHAIPSSVSVYKGEEPRQNRKKGSQKTSSVCAAGKKSVRAATRKGKMATSPTEDDASASLIKLRKALPPHVFVSSVVHSVSFVARDAVLVAVLLAGQLWLEAFPAVWWLLLPVYVFAMGTMMWAVFVLGHDCGHGSFSGNALVNSVFGHLLHSPLLVPYHAWRITHRKHHKNTGNMDSDEIFYPFRAERFRKKPERKDW